MTTDRTAEAVAAELEGVSALATRLASLLRNRGHVVAPALLARALLDADKTRSRLQRHLEHVERSKE